MAGPDALPGWIVPLLKGTGVLTGFVSVVGGIAKGFDWCDKALSPASRRILGQWLKNVPGDEPLTIWAGVFPKLIDRVFGRKPLSWRFFLRSCVASLSAVTVTAGVTVLLLGVRWLRAQWGAAGSFLNFSWFLALALIFNCVPDYLSLLVSRAVVQLMAKRPSAKRIPLLLLLDGICTAAIAYFSLPAGAWFVNLSVGLLTGRGFRDTWSIVVDDYLDPSIFATALQWIQILPAMRVFVIAAFFTSIWVWLYVLASALIRALRGLRSVWTRMAPYLDLDQRPMQAVGRVAGLVAGFVYLALVAAMWTARHL
jgi:hypothetical protein